MKKNPLIPFRVSMALLVLLLVFQQSLHAQMQWYQNQQGPGQYPDGAAATGISNFNSTSFIATYLWQTDGEQMTWKISKTGINGTELKTFFITGPNISVEVKPGSNQAVYALKKSYPSFQNPEFTLYKLNANLEVITQATMVLPGSFTINMINAFELDEAVNIYLAGNGQVDNGGNSAAASFVIKTNKNLVTKWSRIDTAQTSFIRLHVDRSGIVWVVEDHYSFFPDIHLQKISSAGSLINRYTLQTDPARFSLSTAMDDRSNILIYGVKADDNGGMAMYLQKFSRYTGNIVYRKTLFPAAGVFLSDLKTDDNGNIFTLLTQFQSSGELNCRISRINAGTGIVNWNRIMFYSQDSCSLTKLALTDNERIYAVGLRSGNNYFSKGFAVRLKKNGQNDGTYISPDSVAFQRTHYLQDAITDGQNQLIAIGGTTDLDTINFNSTYTRAFAVRLTDNHCNDRPAAQNTVLTAKGAAAAESTETLQAAAILSVYPNPVTEFLNISGLNDGGYNEVAVYNLAGEKLLQRTVSGNSAKIDATSLTAGVYLLQLRSTITLKEKSVKFVVGK
jgi:hypothetical protein